MSIRMVSDVHNDVYCSGSGMVMRREEEYGNEWVLRDVDDRLINRSPYRNDLAELYNLELTRS